MARRGQPPKLTSKVQTAIVKALAAGVPRRFAALAADVSERTLYNWLARGRRESRGTYFQFLQAVKKAEAEAVAARVARIARAAGKGSWQADAWWLERRHPEDFALNRSEVKALARQVAELMRRLDEVSRADRTRPPEGTSGAEVPRPTPVGDDGPDPPAGVDPVPGPAQGDGAPLPGG